MKNKDLKVFKILYSGEIEEIENIELLDLFSLLNVLAFYNLVQKKLYIWVGEHASRTIKNYIVKFRQIFKSYYPEYRVLRYFTIESKAEPFEFFENTGIHKKSLHKKINLEEAKYQEHEITINQIQELKDQADTCFEKEQYEQAIDISINIIEIAKEINEQALVQDQIEFISESKARAKAKSVLKEIRKEKNNLKQKYQNMLQNSDIIQIYNEACNFEQKYLDYLDLTALSDVKTLLNKLKLSFEMFKEEYEKSEDINAYIKEIENLRSKAKDALNRSEFQESIAFFKEILENLNNLK